MARYLQVIFPLLMIFVLANSCETKKSEPDPVDYKSAMLETDREFSKMCEEKGMKHAFMQFVDNKGVLLRPNSMPLVGGEAINYISQGNDTSYVMTWEPNGGSVAVSGELGYTYGLYSLKPKNKDTVFYGTYVSIWKKQPDGKWKFVLETGNEGIE
jgi:ketosteroid isomerase-like protein